MHELAPLIKDLAVILGVASIVTLLFQKIRQPVVLGYLIAGIIIGPYTPPHNLVTDTPNILILSELGVIFLMFSLGLEFSFHKLKRVGLSAGVTGLVEVVLMLVIGLVTGILIGWPFHDSLFLGAALAISSTTIIIKALEELKLKHKRFAELIFGVLIVEDLLAILLLVALSTIVITNQFLSLAMAWATLKLILVVGGWFVCGYFLVPTLLRHIKHYVSEETLTVVSVALCLILVCAAAYFHYSTALGAFIMGSILAETSLVHRIEQLVKPLRDIFAAVFFVSVGMLIDPKVIVEHFWLVILLTIITMVGKVLVTGIGAFLTGQSLNTSLRVGFSMAQIGEFSFIIIALGLSLNAIDRSLYPIIVAVSAITTFTTPYFIRLSGYLTKQLDQNLSDRTKYFLGSYAAWVYRIQTKSKNKPAYSQAFMRLILNGIVIAIIFTVVQNLIFPEINTLYPQFAFNKALSWVCALLLSSPFIWGMLTAFKLVEPTDANQSPSVLLKFLSAFITFTEITILSIAYFNSWLVAIILFVMAIIFFTLFYKQLGKSYAWFENRLLKNLKNPSLKQVRYEELAPWDKHLVEIEVSPQSEFCNNTLQKLQLREQYGINIVAIHRGQLNILAPRCDQTIQEFDKLLVLGSDEQIESFRTQAEKSLPIDLEEPDLLENFTLGSIFLDNHHPAIGKTIQTSQIREQIQGLVVGLERDGKRILNPDSSTILEQGDLLLLVGDSESLSAL